MAAITFAACDNGPSCGVEAADPVAGDPFPLNVAESDFTTTASGLKYFDFTEGAGVVAEVGDSVYVHYTGWLTNGYVFDSSVLNNRSPLPIKIGTSPLIQGWTEGLVGVQAGTERQMVIPSELGYRDVCRDIIPPNSTLIFEVEIVRLVKN